MGSTRRMTTATGDRVAVILPGQLKDLTGGEARVLVPDAGQNVDTLFQALRRTHPAVYERIFTEQRQVRPHVNVFVDGADIRWSGGLETAVGPSSEVVILPAVSGG